MYNIQYTGNGFPAQGIDHVFVQQGCYERWGMYGHNDDLMRFALLSWAALEAPFSVCVCGWVCVCVGVCGCVCVCVASKI